MNQQLKRRIIIVEGVTNSGKTTAVASLTNLMPGCTKIKFSDYYHKSLLRLRAEPEADQDVDQEIRERAIQHNYARYRNLLTMIRSSPVDDYLIERLQLTDDVYQQLLFGRVEYEQLFAIEEMLNFQGALLILLTVNDEVLKQRMATTLPKRNRRRGPGFEIPAHLLSYESNCQKRDLYLESYERTLVQHKTIIDTSYLTPQDLEQKLNEILT